jgi:hypothetical protein
MLKRLFIAVFVLGLIVGLNGTANCDVNKGPAALKPIGQSFPSPEKAATLQQLDIRPQQPTFKKPAAALEANRVLPGVTIANPRTGYFCDEQDYTSGTLGYGWSIPDGYGDDLFNMRFTADANKDCSLKVAHLLMYALNQVGAPTIRVYLWDDDGFGFPGSKLDSVDILNPGDGLQGTNVSYWIDADFSAGNWVFSNGEEYHIGFTQLDVANSVVAVLSDNADGPYVGETRASEYFSSTWGTMLNDWSSDLSFYITAERCCADAPFTDCHSLAYIQNLASALPVPSPAYGDAAYAERFDVNSPETLVSVDLAVYDAGDGQFGTNNIYVTIYDDDNGGVPGTQLAQVTLAPGDYPAYPALATATMPVGFVVDNSFFVSFSTDGVQGVSYERCVGSDGTDGDGRSFVYTDTTNWDGSGDFGWTTMVNAGWGDKQMYYIANLCKDQHSNCDATPCNATTGNYRWYLPDPYGDFAQAQQFQALGPECQVREVTVRFTWNRYDYDLPLYSTSSKVKVWADAGGIPGAEIASITINPGDYGITAPPDTMASHYAYKTVDFSPLNVFLSGNYWVGVESESTDPDSGITVLSDAGQGTCEYRYMEYWGDWGYVADDWFTTPPTTIAMVIKANTCCAPYTPRDCTTPFEWSTFQGDQARDGASFVPMGDSWCDLTLNWHFEHPSQGVSFTGPVVYNDKVICSFTTEYRVFDIDGTPDYTYIPQQGPFAAGDVRCAPTVTMITGYPNPVFFAAGGANSEVACVDLTNGSVVWSRNVNSVGPAGLFGNVRYGVFTVLNDVVYWGTDNGRVVAADALTGALYAGWTVNPINLTQSVWCSGSTDGTNLFYSTSATAAEGDVYSIDAATGAINWQLSAVGGLQGATAYAGLGYGGDESFTGGVSYDAQRNWLYTNSRVALGDYPADGLFYRIDAATGALAGPVTVADRVLYCTPVVDANRVYVNGFSRWASPPSGGTIYAVNKGTGQVDWAVPGEPDDFPYYCSGVLSCEPGDDDQLYVFGYEGFMSCLDADNGNELFRRRVEVPTPGYNERGMAGALAVDGNGDSHLLYADLYGNLFDLTKQADRPRLEFQSYDVTTSVEFGPAASYIVTIPAVFTNTGCADLHVNSVAIDQNDFGVDVPSFSASNVDALTFDRTANIANQIAGNNNLLKLTMPNAIKADGQNSALSVRDNTNERRVDRTAAGFPPFMNGIVHPAVGDVIVPGDTMDLVMDVIQAAILRGPQDFYLQLGTDDPDFFLNDPALLPQMHVTIVGGCLIDTTTLEFGIGGANIQWVTNTGRIGTGDWTPHAFDIDGDGTSYYQGAYVWGVSTYRVATNTQDWVNGGGEANSMVSMQADPNWCDNSCKPFLDAGVTLGYMTSDGGLTYAPINGNMICKSFLDSVQNYYNGTSWAWSDGNGRAVPAPFDNDSTMGLFATGKVVGAVDVPELANVTLELLEITERNGRDVPNWHMGEFWDCDLGNDHVAIDRSISTAWVYNDATATFVWGMTKIPFGCGEEPIINTFETWGNSDPGLEHGFYDWNQFWDTCFTMMTSPPGAYYANPNGSDEEAMMTYAAHDFTPNETYKIGIAHFALFGLTDGSVSTEFASLPILVNKWAGFGRGDVNNDGAVNLADIIYLAGTVNGGPGAVPFQHLSDVNADNAIDMLDVDYLIDYYFNCGPCPVGEFAF